MVRLSQGFGTTFDILKEYPSFCENKIDMSHKIEKDDWYVLQSRWRAMKHRCYNERNKQYVNYGMRGIKIYDKWLANFKEFYKWSIDNGFRRDLTIDRINNDDGYFPENCRWVDNSVQQLNTSRTTTSLERGTRVCSTCRIEKPMTREFFHYSGKQARGYKSECIECRNTGPYKHISLINVDGKRKCPICEKFYTLNEVNFHKDAHDKYGFTRSGCKACINRRNIEKHPVSSPVKRVLVRDRDENRYCTKCETWKRLNSDNFHKDTYNRSGFFRHCKPCTLKMDKEKKERW